jgi:hypothetical protein
VALVFPSRLEEDTGSPADLWIHRVYLQLAQGISAALSGHRLSTVSNELMAGPKL